MADHNDRLLDLEKQVAGQSVLISRFDAALDKISEVSLNVSKLLAVHEQRIEAQEAMTQEAKDARQALHSRVSSTEQRLRQEMSDGQKEILNEIKNLRSDVEELGDDLSDKQDKLKTDLENDFTAKIENVSGRVSKLERLGYLLMGGAAALGFILSQALGFLELLG